MSLFISSIAFGQQEGSDIIYLKDGSILKGKILERLDDGAIKMVMNNGREIIITIKEVKHITIEGIGTNPVDYGGKTAVGISLLGESIVGIHFKVRASEAIFFDVSAMPHSKLVQNKYTDKFILRTNLTLGGEMDYFLQRKYKESKQKIRGNGVFFRVAHGFGRFDQTWAHVGWCSDYFKLNRFKRGFQLNLGAGFIANHWVTHPLNEAYTENVPELDPSVIVRLQWNFYQ